MLALQPFYPMPLDSLVPDLISARALAPRAPTCELCETEAEYTLTMVRPGLSPSDVKATISENGELTLRGETKHATPHMNKRSKLEQTIRLPRDADAAGARLALVDGILTVTVPKRVRAVRVVEVSSSSSCSAAMDGAEDQVMLTLLLPGLAAKDLRLAVDQDGVLSVHGETKTQHQTYSAVRKAQLPRDTDTEAVSATLLDGVLTVSAPKKQVVCARELKVEAAPLELESPATDATQSMEDAAAK